MVSSRGRALSLRGYVLIFGFIAATIWYQKRQRAQLQSATRSEVPTNYNSLDAKRWTLQDLEKSAVPVNTITKLDLSQYSSSYWTAQLDSVETPILRVPIYPGHSNNSEGYFLCPRAGQYSLTIRIPVPGQQDSSVAHEPPICLNYRQVPAIWELQTDFTQQYAQTMVKAYASFGFKAPLSILRCTPEKGSQDLWQPGEKYIGPPAPDTLGRDASIVAAVDVFCESGFDGSSTRASKQQVQSLTDNVYGPARSLFINSASDALGYWTLDTVVSKEAGSLSYQPQPEHCPETYFPTIWQNSHQDKCGLQAVEPSFRWTPYTESRRQWMLSPATVQKCLKQPLRFYGDSIGHQYRRAFSCVARGYARAMEVDYSDAITNLMIETLPIFAPGELVPTLDDAILDAILLIDKSPQSRAEIEVWAIGMWIISYIPSKDWERGIAAILSRISARSKAHGTQPFFTLLSAPAAEPQIREPMWQTVDRARKWNQLIMKIAPTYEIPLLDAFFPTVHRFDARIDNAHTCDVLNMETAMIMLRAICQSTAG